MRGAQQPRVEAVPSGSVHPDGEAALELVAAAGLILDPWQERVFSKSLLRSGRKWAAFEVGVVAPRQNGKNAIIEARELAALFLFGDRLVIHSAHQFDTSLEAFRRLLELIEANDWLSREVKRVSRSHGEEGLELRSGQRIRFRTRTRGGGRGFSGDLVVFDEAMSLPEASLGAIVPVVSARPDPQLWYAGSAVDEQVHEHGVALARLRERAIAGGDPSLAYFEWSYGADEPGKDAPEKVTERVATDPEAWAQANPGLGIRISPDHVANEQRSAMGARAFAVERLGVGEWPQTSTSTETVIDLARWARLTDRRSTAKDPVCFAFDVPPDRSWGSIGVAGQRPDGRSHLEVVDRKRGTGWIPTRMAELLEKHESVAAVCDAAGPAGSLLHELNELGVTVVAVSAKEHAYGCGLLVDGVEQDTIRHLAQAELTAALQVATKRPLGDAWAWSRKGSSVDISPLVAVTLALWGLATLRVSSEPMVAYV